MDCDRDALLASDVFPTGHSFLVGNQSIGQEQRQNRDPELEERLGGILGAFAMGEDVEGGVGIKKIQSGGFLVDWQLRTCPY